MVLLEVARVDEIPPGRMKHVEGYGKEILIANIDGKFYAVEDRCAHMSAPLWMGGLSGKIITCALHGAQFDITTGRKVTDPKMVPPPGMEQLPPGFLKALEHSGQLMAAIRTYDLQTYELLIDGNRIEVKFPDSSGNEGRTGRV